MILLFDEAPHDYVRFKLELTRARPRQSLCYFVQGEELLIDAREMDPELDKIARLVMAMQEIGLGVGYQQRVEGVMHYAFKPAWKKTPKEERTFTTNRQIAEAERVMGERYAAILARA